MAKPMFQDIVPPERRSIKRISRPTMPPREREARPVYEEEIMEPRRIPMRPLKVERPAHKESFLDELDEEIHHIHDEPMLPPIRNKKKGVNFLRIGITMLAVIIILGTGFWFISRVSGAQVVVTPRQSPVSVDSQFTAVRTGDGLQFQTVTIAKDGKLGIAANGEEIANVKASGTIVIYNTTGTAQKLVANTRFETPKGLIFRIAQPVTIPPRTVEGGTSVPGSIEAIVTAEATGPEYNVGLTDFTVPGFKDDQKYTQIYARTKVPMQGGFAGTRKKVDQEEMTVAREKVRDELKATLVREAMKNIPSGFVLPADAFYIQYESLPDTQVDTGVQINERANFRGFIFNRTQLASEISKKVNGPEATNTDPSDIAGIDTLSFKIKDTGVKEPWNSPTITFTLTGKTSLVSVVDTDKVKTDLMGKPRKSLNAILAGYPAVAKAEVTMRPFWKNTFPTNTEEITVTVAEAELSPQ